MFAKQLNAFLNSTTPTEGAIAPISLEDMIAEGESEELEFKSTLRWDLKEGIVNKKLEEVVLKTVAAFANSHGGSLLIGVGDDGTIVGLEHDYASLGDADRDKFELHLRNLLNQQLGTGFVTSKIKIKFHHVVDKELCEVETSQAKEPIILNVKDKGGQTFEKFYVRSGNSSQELPLSEVSAYIKERFHS